jgi:3-hydroxyacyl-CoA dehydrogenase
MVLIGVGRSFIAGADIRQVGTRRPPPFPGRLTHEILDTSAKPVVAAIHGCAWSSPPGAARAELAP